MTAGQAAGIAGVLLAGTVAALVYDGSSGVEPAPVVTTTSSPLVSPNSRRLVVCPAQAGVSRAATLGGRTMHVSTARGVSVRYLRGDEETPSGCVLVIDAVDVDKGAPVGAEAELERVCSPCKVSPRSWGPCPECLLQPGGCAAACPAPAAEP